MRSYLLMRPTPFLVVVLLTVPLLLGACRGRTVLEGESETGGKKKVVVGKVVPENRESNAAVSSPTQIWFTKTDGEQIKYEAQDIQLSTGASKVEILRAALTKLLERPSADSGLASEIPQGTTLLNVGPGPTPDSFTIDLSGQFIHGGGMDSFEARVEQVKRTAVGIVGDRPVYLFIDGHKLEASGDGLEVKQPIN